MFRCWCDGARTCWSHWPFSALPESGDFPPAIVKMATWNHLEPSGTIWLSCCSGFTLKLVDLLNGYGSIPIDTFLVGWTSIYQLFWGSLGTRVLTHPQMIQSLQTLLSSYDHLKKIISSNVPHLLRTSMSASAPPSADVAATKRLTTKSRTSTNAMLCMIWPGYILK